MAEPKADLRKLLPDHFRAPAGEWVSVDLPPVPYLMIDGQGSPGEGPEYRRALETLYPAAYAIKFHCKQKLGRDYVVPPLEGLWWSDDLDAFTTGRRDEWRWTMMIMLPGWIGPDVFAAVMAAAARKKPDIDFAPLRRAVLDEGASLQTLHLGSFADEAPVLARLHDEVMPARGLTFAGPHHEVYLSDPRRTAPEKQRTILRQPVKPV
jgi:hypothetical protein